MNNLIILTTNGLFGLDLITLLGVLFVQAVFMIIVIRIALDPLKNQIIDIKELLEKQINKNEE